MIAFILLREQLHNLAIGQGKLREVKVIEL